MKAVCPICPKQCALEEGELGFCRARVNRGGVVVSENYGRVTSLALDPIEKKPLRRFYPGSMILSVGSYGCNMDCGYCQNSSIARADASTEWEEVSPESLVALAKETRVQGNIGIAFTYNEPLVGYEFVLDAARLAKGNGLKTVLVTNGMIQEEPWGRLLPFLDATNIDLKSFSKEGYRALGGDLETVKRNISGAAGKIHLELTTLIVPGFNDSEQEIRDEAAWIASLDSQIPLHLSRFFPRHSMLKKPPTSSETLHRLANIARENLEFVYIGNL